MSSINYDQLRGEVTLAAVLELLCWEPTLYRGDERRGPCPLCERGGKRPAFSADLARGVWYCHRCRAGGAQLELVAAVWHLDLYLAARELCRRLGKRVPYLPRRRNRGEG